ncbi:hypothetical protein CspeluHIS016_0300690 [Cutaneotrichosporon spelunceum]|uniref:Protein kinase domain-containing protein n=1 Tax=Cutaneotrichosporon spelunceum TaxID=1672016 RepID=A0AAD3YBW7_9TREE|nr:hypothetical protein CspeluHIS016_0300690 [Cutaneotrichosporon spelunceum]
MRSTTKGLDLAGRTTEWGIELKSILGVGAYGAVYLARDWNSACACPRGCPCRSSVGGSSAPHYEPHTFQACPCEAGGAVAHLRAVKCLSRKGLDERQRLFQRREIMLHTLASSHTNITAIHKVLRDDEYTYIVMDYLPGGDLFAMIADRGRYVGDDELVRSVFLQIVDAIRHCHDMGIYHRDLKPENILCSADGTKVVLADFGLATTEPVSRDFGCGSTFYLSPECQGGLFEPVENYSTVQADLWSLGIILINLACVRNPWKQATIDDETFRAYIEDPSILPRILPLSTATAEICAGLFAANPADRISLAQLTSMVKRAPSFSAPAMPAPPIPPQQPISPPHIAPYIAYMPSYTSEYVQTPPSDMPDVYGYFAPPPSPYAQFLHYAPPTPTYISVPVHNHVTPAGTPGLVGSDECGFRFGASSTSSSNSQLPTPQNSPMPPSLQAPHGCGSKLQGVGQPTPLLHYHKLAFA